MTFFRFILSLLYFISFTLAYPTVLMHGVLANKQNMDELKILLELNFKISVYNIEIGNGVNTSIFTSMDLQLEMLCDIIYNMEELKDGFNFIGMSQGGLLARGYVEYCNKYPVINLITLVSPNGGIYFKTEFSHNFYEPLQQSTLSISNYWRDPYNYNLYLLNSTYLAKLNDELFSNSHQNDLDVVKNFIMIWSTVDEVIKPPESAKFSLQYIDEIDGKLKSSNLIDTYIYKSGRLGLKKLYEENRLKIFSTNCKHSQHKKLICFHQLKLVFEQYLL